MHLNTQLNFLLYELHILTLQVKYYQTKYEPPKKEQRTKTLSVNVQKFLAKREEEEKLKATEAQKRRDELLALRAQDKKATRRVNVMLKRTKSANQSVLAEAVDNNNTAVTMAGPSQPDEDDYGYVSQEAAAFYNQMMEKYSKMPDEPKFPTAGKKVSTNLSNTKDRVRAALEREKEEAMMPKSRKRKHHDKSEDRYVEEEPIYKEEKKEEKPNKPKFKAPPPMNFNDLLKIAEKKQFEPIVIEKKEKEDERLLTKKQKLEIERERERQDRKRSGEISGRIPKLSNKGSGDESNKKVSFDPNVDKSSKKSDVSKPNKVNNSKMDSLFGKSNSTSSKLEAALTKRDPKYNDRIPKRDDSDRSSNGYKQPNTNGYKSSYDNKSSIDNRSSNNYRASNDHRSSNDNRYSSDHRSTNDYRYSNDHRSTNDSRNDLKTQNGHRPSNDFKSNSKTDIKSSNTKSNGLKSTNDHRPNGIKSSSEYQKQVPYNSKTKDVRSIDNRDKQFNDKKSNDQRPKQNLPKDLKPKQSPPADLKPKQFPPSDLRPKQFPPSDLRPKQFPPKDLKPKQFPPADLRPKQFPPADVRRKDVRKPNVNLKKRRIVDDDDSEYDSEMDDFIDDGPEEEEDYSKYISEIFGYDKRKYKYVDEGDDRGMESSWQQQMREEQISAKIGIMEDLEDMKLEEQHKKRKLMMKKQR